MNRKLIFFSSLLIAGCQTPKVPPAPGSGQAAKDVASRPALLSKERQLTMSGKRSGEGYFSKDGELMIFQSEREAKNPFYQIYLMNLKNQKIHRVSNGIGKTTCSWIFLNKKDVIYSSTFADPASAEHQKNELAARESGQQKRYAWDYDPQFEIYLDGINGGRPKNLTRALGYDAEGSVSPDGKWIVFASNRHAYATDLSDFEKKKLEEDPSYFIDLYLMAADGTETRRLTNHNGYDGGPFFGPDNETVIFRRFSENGSSAEVFTINIRTGAEKQITRLGTMSWAPFFHPSGDYVVFTSNLYGFSNFELFIVDSQGARSPIRITESDGFDGLPVFLPGGTELTWNRKLPNGDSQMFIADWDDQAARAALGLPKQFPTLKQVSSHIRIEDAQLFVNYLASPILRGRATGSEEEKVYTAKIAEYFKSVGLSPLNGSFFIDFPFSRQARLGSGNELVALGKIQSSLVLGEDWVPLSFSQSAATAATEVIFVGYGLVAPASIDQTDYDSYKGVDVTDRWVMMLRYSPENVDQKRREYLQRYSRLEHKVMMARQRGARGVIVVNGPESKAKSKLIRFQQTSSSDAGTLSVSVSTSLAVEWMKLSGQSLTDIQKRLDDGEVVESLQIKDLKLSANVNIAREKGSARNVAGFLRAPGATKTLIVGAHGDHLGQGHSESSLMNSNDKSDIHHGADDNASGVAGVLELAHQFATKSQQVPPRQNLLFAVWSGEELGNLGSAAMVSGLKRSGLNVSAYINMDMIGRLTNDGKTRPLAVQGVGSSSDWRPLIEQIQSPIGLSLSDDPYLPTDAMSFYVAEVPVLSFFSGVHSDYHTPRDTSDKIDYQGLVGTLSVVGAIAEKLAWDGRQPKYLKVTRDVQQNRRGFRIFLGTVPDYADPDIKGVKLSGVIKGGPAEKAGIRTGDIIVKLASYDIRTIHDYVYSLDTMKPGEETSVIVVRDGKQEELKIVPQARD